MISIIAAVGRNLEIGYQGRRPWVLPNDLKHFKETTRGKVVIMGSATYQSFLDVTLADRIVYVLSREPKLHRKAYHAFSVEDAINQAAVTCGSNFTREIIVTGGVGVFREAIELADRAYITLVEGDFQADRYFPVGLDHFFNWKCMRSDTFFPTPRDPHQHTIYEFQRPKGL